MSNPVTGPYFTAITLKGPPTYYGFKPDWVYRSRTWYRQAKPYVLPLPFSFLDDRVTSFSGGRWNIEYVSIATAWPVGYSRTYTAQHYNRVYSLFMNELKGVTATLGATMGEWKTSLSMIEHRATQLYSGFKAAKRGDLSGLRALWGKHAGIRGRSRALGNHVLEYSFGWAPLVKDLNSALDVLHRGIPPFIVRTKRGMRGIPEFYQVDYGNSMKNFLLNYYAGWRLQGRVDINNPNSALANDLGLVNLASVVWELIPNSYIVDYFVNVGEFLDSFTDNLGYDVTHSSNTLFTRTTTSVTGFWKPFKDGYPDWSPTSWSAERVTVQRSVGLPKPTLVFKKPWVMSAARGSTAIARLLQLIDPRGHRDPGLTSRLDTSRWARYNHKM